MELFPGPDDPELAAAFEAQREAEGDRGWRNPNPDAGDGGFATGGDRTSLRLHAADEALILAVAAACPRTVVVVTAGSAVMVEAWHEAVPAIVLSWYPGMEGGHALADLLLGSTEPVGRLPFTVPTDEAHLPPFDRDAEAVVYDGWHGYWRLARDGHVARYPFGFGLSYTDLSIERAAAVFEASGEGVDAADAHVVVAATVSNRGSRPGVEVVQVYASAADAPPRLAGFARVPLEATRARPRIARLLRPAGATRRATAGSSLRTAPDRGCPAREDPSPTRPGGPRLSGTRRRRRGRRFHRLRVSPGQVAHRSPMWAMTAWWSTAGEEHHLGVLVGAHRVPAASGRRALARHASAVRR